MIKETKKRASFKAGMYLLDSFTTGMYNDPLTIYREYVQNAVDSIDVTGADDAVPLEVRIELQPAVRQITIRDNAMGIPASLAGQILSSIGSSNKKKTKLRGFRGIGRLGGIAFSDKAVFRTKAKGESVESIQEWDCRMLREILSTQNKDALTLGEVFRRITTFDQKESDQVGESFFQVMLYGVTSFRNQLFDLERVRRYLGQVVPVPFNPREFSYSEQIDKFLSSKLTNYGQYNIILNGKPVFKPYRDVVKITKGAFDHIDGIEFIEIKNGKAQPIAHGWYGRRRELLGAIARGDDASGLRIRIGNLQIGDAHLLDFCFREPRFNGYVAGEVHVESSDLIPNSRRDDFIDNLSKGFFYNAIEKEIGLPISREIRTRSRLASNQQPHSRPVTTPRQFCADASQCSKAGQESGTKPSPSRDAGGQSGDVQPAIPRNGAQAMGNGDTLSLCARDGSLAAALKSNCGKCAKLSRLYEILGQNKSTVCL